MKIEIKNGNLFFQDFGGRNFVVLESAGNEMIVKTMLQAVLHSVEYSEDMLKNAISFRDMMRNSDEN